MNDNEPLDSGRGFDDDRLRDQSKPSFSVETVNITEGETTTAYVVFKFNAGRLPPGLTKNLLALKTKPQFSNLDEANLVRCVVLQKAALDAYLDKTESGGDKSYQDLQPGSVNLASTILGAKSGPNALYFEPSAGVFISADDEVMDVTDEEVQANIPNIIKAMEVACIAMHERPHVLVDFATVQRIDYDPGKGIYTSKKLIDQGTSSQQDIDYVSLFKDKL